MSVEESSHPGSILETPAFTKSINDVLVNLDTGGEDAIKMDTEGVFTWHIDNWNVLKNDKVVSPQVTIGDFDWDVLLFPQGNRNKSLALYLEPNPKMVKDTEEDKMVPEDPAWYCCAQFAVVLSRPGSDNEIYVINRSHHRFDNFDTDWGFANLIDLYSLKNQIKGKLSGFVTEDGQLNITVYVRILEDKNGVLWHNFVNYDSKKVTGYVGFRNQGATCYLNSLLQSYFFTKYFRKLVYEIPTDEEKPNDSVPLALQRAFYQLQVSNLPLDTLELTRSFGWDSADAFTQHDVQELNRILMDRLETRMKGTKVEGKLSELFVGKMKSYIKCKNVDYESSRVEEFWDIQLNVKDLKNLQQSFENYIEVELMDGENQYAAPDFGLQDAYKGVVFESFPKVLHLQLKRFEYDFNFDQLIKINDRYEFPDSIDLSPYLDKDVLKNENETESHIYKLHGVLVHTGDISTGHYYTMIKPDLGDQWYRFDDERVWKVDRKQVFDENFGLDKLPDSELRGMTKEEYQSYLITRHTSAYMLVYVKDEVEEEILQPVTETDVPQHVVKSIKEETEQYELREKELREAHLYVKFNIHTIKNFLSYQGFDISPNPDSELFDEELYGKKAMPLSLKVSRKLYLKDLYKQINELAGIPHGKNVRYWKMDYRKGGTLRLVTPMNSDLDSVTLEEATGYKEDELFPLMDIFIEEPYLDLQYLSSLKEKNILESVELTEELIDNLRQNIFKLVPSDYLPIIHDIKTHSLIFIKKFSLANQTLVGYGHQVVAKNDEINFIANTLSKISGIPTDIIQFFEEISPNCVQMTKLSDKIFEAELISGDILSFQDTSVADINCFPLYENITQFYNFLRYRVKLVFSKAKNSVDDYVVNTANSKTFEVWVPVNISYDELANIVSQNINEKAEYLKLFAIYPNEKYNLRSNCILKDYLLRDYNCSLTPTFEYEVLSMPLKDLESLRSIRLYWLTDTYIHFQLYDFKIPNHFSVKEFKDKIQNKVGFSDSDKNNILFWTNSNFKFANVIFDNNSFDDVGKGVLLFARILPEELKLLHHLDNLENTDETESYSSTNESNSTTQDHKKPNDHLVVVMQCFKGIENRHGISFLFDLRPNENLSDAKSRLHKKFGLGEREFNKIKFNLLVRTYTGKVLKSLQDLTEEEEQKIILYNIMGHLDIIYMDHPDRLKSQSSQDRPMTIK
ncbi:hypothetical protein TPHA_0L02290 [Tetrapisispora phaffii CBS 4417]|uniref:ubiquitinyl hydrolase 1 n=1 Tax=Tetrapisispora phaffii (strain ATCC 24235 / CBS 4417 / NBRC 1672 / NRRL Y-8282 / UCD 70-5) TaxID=1071381 RepID=G8C0A2_TETPH|nr:hypothetical protein TPHA_0L02290 [Tetrapisispora phaffii CBS 4417]CCE65580.1 hypothetical protein TPHA_0L02290 [Tetrapisispora phaffii CBS 4417]